MDAWEWWLYCAAIIIGYAYVAFIAYHKGKERGHDEEIEKRKIPGTATIAQMAKIERIGQEMHWDYPELEEWTWVGAQMRLMHMRDKKREIEEHQERIAAGEERRPPTEMRLGIRWDDAAQKWVPRRRVRHVPDEL